jgi:hypothetical protein
LTVYSGYLHTNQKSKITNQKSLIKSVHSWLSAESKQLLFAYKSKIKIQKSAPESFARTGEAIVNQIRAFVAKSFPPPSSHFRLNSRS